MNISEKLLEIRTSSGKSQADFAKMAGVSQRTWSSYESGETTPKMGILWALAANGYPIKGVTTSLTEDWSEENKNEFNGRIKIAEEGAFPEDMLAESVGQYLSHISEFSFFKFSNKKPVPIPTHGADPNAMVMLPVYSQVAAAGAGQPPTQLEEIEAYMPVIYELLGGANPRNCGIVRVVGDSMTDMTLFNGDVVIFDRNQIEGNGVYVISMGGDVRVKRLEYRIFEKKIIISSENHKSYPNPEIISFEEAQETLVIHGKVISWVHRHPY